jgi:hypothetical protein
MEEIWKDIDGYDGKYKISNFGTVVKKATNTKCKKFGKEKKLSVFIEKGYCICFLYNNKIGKRHRVHRLLMSVFVGASNLTVDHIDGNKLNNRIDNLEYVTIEENIKRYHKLKNKGKNYHIGVRKNKEKYTAETQINGKKHYIGTFVSFENAVFAYNSFLNNYSDLSLYEAANEIR